MTLDITCALITVLLLPGYEAWLLRAQRQQPGATARSAHAALREDWFAAVSAQPGSEILAVQTLRNSLMSATMTASTAVLALMGTLTLTAPSLQAGLSAAPPTPRLAMELVLLGLLASSLVASAMAVRYYKHAGFVGGMPVESDARRRWSAAGAACVRRAGLYYSWGLRQLIFVAPVLAYLLHPLAGPAAALATVAMLAGYDRVTPGTAPV
jgi:uncharacterized membrane protein